MTLLGIVLVTAALSPQPPLGVGTPRLIEVDCTVEGALEETLAAVSKLDSADVYLHGVCKGHFVLRDGNVTLRAGSPGAGLEAPAGGFGTPVLEVDDARASLRGLSVRGGVLGVHVHGWEAEVLLYQTVVREQVEVGVVAERGARVRLLDSSVQDGYIGLIADESSGLNLQNVVVSGFYTGVIVSESSFAALNDTTIENNAEAGLAVNNRSDANVNGAVFRNNGAVHVHAADWSSIGFSTASTLGSASDTTEFALGASDGATISCYIVPQIFGHVSALTEGSIRLGNTVLHGDVLSSYFAKVHLRSMEVTGVVACSDGSEAICRQTTTGGAIDCPSPTCGAPPAAAAGERPALAYEPPEPREDVAAREADGRFERKKGKSP